MYGIVSVWKCMRYSEDTIMYLVRSGLQDDTDCYAREGVALLMRDEYLKRCLIASVSVQDY